MNPDAALPVLVIAVGGLLLLLTALVVLTHLLDLRTALAALVGVTGGLQAVQLAKVHVFCVVTAAWLVVVLCQGRKDRPRIAWPLALLGASALLASTVLTGELVNNPLLGGQLMVLAVSAACLAMFGDARDCRAAALGLLSVTTVNCLAALLQYAGVLPYQVFLGTHRPIGFYSEPDVLGTFAAAGLVVAYREAGRRLRLPLIGLHVVVLLMAAARAAWVAVAVVAVIGFVMVRVRGERRRADRLVTSGWSIAALVLVVVGVVLASPALRDTLSSRIVGNESNTNDVGTTARKQQLASLLELESQAPWHGLGLSASGRVGASGKITYLGDSENSVATNWILAWWVDGGVLAVPLICLFLAAAARRTTTTSGQLLGIALVSSLFSNVLFFPISWLAVGLTLARGAAPRPVPPAIEPDPDGAAHPDTEQGSAARSAEPDPVALAAER